MNLEDMSPELQERARACKTPEETPALAKDAGYELSDDELAAIAGGGWGVKDVLPRCPECGSYAISVFPVPGSPGMSLRVCNDCGWSKTCTPIG